MVPLIDAFMASDEVAFIRYRQGSDCFDSISSWHSSDIAARSQSRRLHAHENSTIRTVICESNVTLSRDPKPYHVTDALTAAEVARFHVRFVHVPFVVRGHLKAYYAPVDDANGLRPSAMRDNLASAVATGVAGDKEVNDGMRYALNIAVAEELGTLRDNGTPLEHVYVFLADVDEILDLPAVTARVQGSHETGPIATSTLRAKRSPAQLSPVLRGSTSMSAITSSEEPAGTRSLPPSPPSPPPPFSCISPNLRYFFYGLHCHKAISWKRSLLFRASVYWRLLQQKGTLAVLTMHMHMHMRYAASDTASWKRCHTRAA